MFKEIILGTVQGIAEWLPVSSEGLLVLIQVNFFHGDMGLKETVHKALFLHLGTFLAALVYLRKKVLILIKAVFSYGSQKKEVQQTLKFLIIATAISGVVGIILLEVGSYFEERLNFTGKAITLILGSLLLITALIQLKAKREGKREVKEINTFDMILLGFVQGLTVLPGLSRSGLTISTLLLRKFKKDQALKLSFLMSLPIVLGGNIIINLPNFTINTGMLINLVFSFIFGILTIHFLLKLAKKINFGYFVFLFGVLTILSTLI